MKRGTRWLHFPWGGPGILLSFSDLFPSWIERTMSVESLQRQFRVSWDCPRGLPAPCHHMFHDVEINLNSFSYQFRIAPEAHPWVTVSFHSLWYTRFILTDREAVLERKYRGKWGWNTCLQGNDERIDRCVGESVVVENSVERNIDSMRYNVNINSCLLLVKVASSWSASYVRHICYVQNY